jgi:hypothetical protein
MKGYRRSNLGRRSRRGWLTAAPTDDDGGAMRRAAAPRPLLHLGGLEGYDEPFSTRSNPMGAAQDGELT